MNPARQSKKLDSLVTDLMSQLQPGETVIGLGNDIVEVRRIAALIDRPGGSFLRRSFTPAEIDECAGRGKPAIHYAGKWAAKEAVYKALKLRWDRPFSWKEIEVVASGEGPRLVNLSGQIREQQQAERDQAQWNEQDRGFEPPRLLISISHCEEYAFAVALAVGPA